MEAIRIECEGSALINLNQLTPLQGDLKSLSEENYARLKKVILELGFSAPFHVWVNDNVPYILDGTQRFRTLTRMADEGFKIPPLPINEIQAKTKKEAMRKLLALASQYGRVEGQGLYEFLTMAELDIADVMMENSFPDINLDHFAAEYYDGWRTDYDNSAVDKINENLDGIVSIIKISCPQEKKDEIIEFLKLNILKDDVRLES